MINGVEQIIAVEQALEGGKDINTAMGKNADILATHK